jgi:hypothetical protein
VRWQQQHRVAIAAKVAIIRSNNRGEAFNPQSASVSAGGSNMVHQQREVFMVSISIAARWMNASDR